MNPANLSPKDKKKLAGMVRDGDVSRRVAKQSNFKDVQKVAKALRGYKELIKNPT